MPQKAMGTTLSCAQNNQTVQIGRLRSISEIKADSEAVVVTTLDAAGGFRTYTQGLKDMGEVTLTGFHEKDEAGQQKLRTLYESGETYFVAWGTEDYKVLQTGCERHKIENPVKYEDYLDLALAYRLWKGDDYTTGLKKATEEQEVNTAGLWHTAFDDANNTGKLLIEMFNRGWKLEDFFVAREAYEAERAARQAERAKHHNGYRRW